MSKKVKHDKIILGAMAGAAGGAIGLVFSYTMYLLGISPMSSLHLAAALVVTDIIYLTPGGVIWSIVTHLTVSSVFGILLTYLFMYIGREYWIFKGIGTGAVFCLLAHSYLIPLMRTDAQVRSLIFNAPSFGTMITTHSLIGLVTAYIIVRTVSGWQIN
jgi:uncharacterized membrane protein YagU involved in acid resistance